MVPPVPLRRKVGRSAACIVLCRYFNYRLYPFVPANATVFCDFCMSGRTADPKRAAAAFGKLFLESAAV